MTVTKFETITLTEEEVSAFDQVQDLIMDLSMVAEDNTIKQLTNQILNDFDLLTDFFDESYYSNKLSEEEDN